ncbi:MAG TPA: YdeI/OmpD-associated family protein [Verrucomicrobiae bacterium]|nr:YdeI/OmpD-associated family protein [Verrucomicrobiae bacterium]
MTGIPKDFADALRAAGLSDLFQTWTASHRREYLKWISEAKRPETRKERIRKSIAMISARRSQTA